MEYFYFMHLGKSKSLTCSLKQTTQRSRLLYQEVIADISLSMILLTQAEVLLTNLIKLRLF